MNSVNRIILNTIVQYSRSVLNIFLSLFSTRYIVEALGKSDYGIYLLIGGVVAMLGFITNALVTTTQRHVSYYHGKNDVRKVKHMFANSLFVHAAVSLAMVIILFSLRDVIVFKMLNIPEGREVVAAQTYNITVFLLVATIMIAPYKALFIARENITYISIVEVVDGVIKLAVALLIINANTDKLMLYASMMLLIHVFNIFALVVYAVRHFEEARVFFNMNNVDKRAIAQLLGFAGWSTYGMGAVVIRSQGIQWMLNNAYDTVMNAAYGIGMQVYGSVSFVASSVLNAMNPQIMKAEGEGNREKMLYLAEKESKYSTMLLLLIVVPLIVEMPSVMSFWLKDVPEYADMFCRFILIGFIIDQSTFGMNVANQAMGRIKIYTLLMYTPKLLALIPIFIILRLGYSPLVVMCVYLMSEILVSCARVPYIKHTCGLKIPHFVKTVILPLLPLLLAELFVSALCVEFIDIQLRFLITVPLAIASGLIVVWFVTLTTSERLYFVNIINKKFHRR